jgi:hypothetical protein
VWATEIFPSEYCIAKGYFSSYNESTVQYEEPISKSREVGDIEFYRSFRVGVSELYTSIQ